MMKKKHERQFKGITIKQEYLSDLITALVTLNLFFSTFGHFESFYLFLRN